MTDPIEESVERMLRDPEFHGIMKSFVVAHLRAVVGGDRVYMAKMPREDRSKRAQLLKQEFTGNNLAELADRHSISIRHARRLIQRK